MPAYVPDPTDATQPTTNQLAGNMAAELQALKGRINSLVAGGSNFYYSGSFRNRLKNGCFSVAQRGVGVTVGAGIFGYTIDQWIVYSTGSATTITQGSAVGTANKYVTIAPALGNTFLQFMQRIEAFDCTDMTSGTPVTVSGFYYVTNVAAGLPSIALYTPTVVDNYGAIATVGPAVAMTVSPALAANTWQFFSYTFTLSAAATTGLGLYFTWAAGAPGQSISFDSVQLEKGSQYTPFEQRPVEVELAMCQRYYQTLHVDVWGYGAATNTFAQKLTLPTTMRIAPVYSVVAAGSLNNCSANTIDMLSVDSFRVVATVTVTGAAYWYGAIIGLSAEI